MRKDYEEQLMGKQFKGNWSNSLIFTFGFTRGLSVYITWMEGEEEVGTTYPLPNVWDNVNEGIWVVIENN